MAAQRTQKQVLDEILEKVNRVEAVLITGDPERDQPGALERLRRVEAWQRAERYLIGALGLVVFGDGIMRLWTLILSHYQPSP